MDAISKLLYKKHVHFVRIDGKTKAEARAEIVHNFQSDANIRCAVLSIRACSAGITLTAANTVVFAELDWTPSNIIQAEARVHRIGQERPVKIYVLVAPKTSDEIMWRMLKEKQRNLAGIGLVASNEQFSQNTTTTTFETASTSNAEPPKANLITNYMSPTPSKSPESRLTAVPSASPELFYSCENFMDDDLHDDSDDFLVNVLSQVEKAEAKMKEEIAKPSAVEELLEGIDFDDEMI